MRDNVKTVETVKESYNSKREKIIDKTGTMHRAPTGITLISLIITIIVLLILAGVALNFVIGENGILRQAEFARNKYQNASEQEKADLEAIFGYLDNQTLPDNTPTTDAGTPVKIPDKWQTETPNYTRTTDGKIVTTSTKIATVTAISDGTGKTVPVPAGFYYVGGTIDSGVVISDNKADQNKYAGVADVPAGISLNADGTIKYDLVGNQFVWIPVTDIDDYKTYEWTSYRICYSYLDTSSYEKTMVEKYGGFYVGRFEAGLATTIYESRSEIKHDQTYTNYNVSGIPQVKPGAIPWMFIDYTKSKANAQSLYKDKTSVKSGLLTGTMWDSMITWMAGSSTSTELTTNCTWGNYEDRGLKYEIGRTAAGTYKNSSWYLGAFSGYTDRNNITYTSGTLPTYSSSTNAGTLLTTGASKDTKKRNLYDVAGNVLEWTEEVAYYRSIATTAWLTSSEHRVSRGGSFIHTYSTAPACYRSYASVENTSLNIGFRVALYMK